MIRGLYTAASGMLYEQKRQENIAQNMSNVETNGFKQTLLLASSEERRVVNQNGRHEVGDLTLKVAVDEAYLSLDQGQFKTTNQTRDFAINGAGFFVLEGPDNELLYTRDGNFHVDNDGRLVSKEGYPVITADGGYAVVNDDTIQMNADGNFTVGGAAYQLLVVTLDENALIRPTGGNQFRYEGDPTLADAGTFEIMQGMVESSNVNMSDEMVNLMSSNRAMQINSKVLQAMDQMLAQAVSEIGRL